MATIDTIVIWGFPGDVKDRELRNLLWTLPEIKDSWLTPDDPTCGVARFFSQYGALNAAQAIECHTFDANHQLSCSLAERNPEFGEQCRRQQSRDYFAEYTETSIDDRSDLSMLKGRLSGDVMCSEQ
jgi:hypothetical protein